MTRILIRTAFVASLVMMAGCQGQTETAKTTVAEPQSAATAASAGCPDVAASKQELVITGPCEKAQVAYREFVEGTVKDPNAQVWVIINPLEVGDYWVQPAVTVRSDGKWKVLVYFGEPEHKGKPYQLAAVANPKEPLKEGQLLKSWPEAQWRSDPVNVVRK